MNKNNIIHIIDYNSRVIRNNFELHIDNEIIYKDK